MAEKKTYLVDGSGYIFRAYYAVNPNLKTSDGFPTNALFGFIKMLLKLLGELDGARIAVVFDAGRITFRNELYPEYKANRDECPEDLAQQMPYFRDFCKALGLQVLEVPGYEADDVIATLAKRLTDLGEDAVVVSGDKDLMQLVNDHISIWDTMKDRRYDSEGVKEKMGVPPEQVTEFLGLTGDSSDNIPGMRGVGPKTAVQLIEMFGDVETILQSAEVIKETKGIRNRNKISEQIELDPEIIRLSRRLVEVVYDVPITLSSNGNSKGNSVELDNCSDSQFMEQLERNSPDEEGLRALIEKFEFHSLFRDLNLNPPRVEEAHNFTYTTVYADQFEEWFTKFSQQSSFSFDLETTAIDTLAAEIVGFAFCWDDSEAWYIPVGHQSEDREQVPLSTVLEMCQRYFENPEIDKFGQNLKYDISVLARYGIPVKGVGFDTMIASYLLNPDRQGGGHSLGALAREYLGKKASEYKEVVGDLANFSEVPIEEATNYAAEDAHFAWLLTGILKEKIGESQLDDVLKDIEVPLVSVLAKMEQRGVKLDSEYLYSMGEELEKEIIELEKTIYSLAGAEFNINSPKQLSDILFNQLGIPTVGLKKTKTGTSTDSTVLEKLSVDYEIADAILQYRTSHKLKTTYVDALPQEVSLVTRRLHTKFNQTVTATGRLSSSDPNLQNIPIQTEQGRRIRKAFVAEPGNVLLSADYSQIELRLLAHMSGDENLVEAFQEGLDIHTQTAREILGISQAEEVRSDERRLGKTINFGIIYGMSGFRLGRELGIPVGEATKYIEQYFNYFSGVKEYFEKLEHDAEEQGYVTTMFGRRRIISNVDATGRDRGFLRRVAINAPIQGSAADIVKLAMIRIDKAIGEQDNFADMLLQIHDELVFECPQDKVETVEEFVRTEMEEVVELDVPLKVDVGHGANWEEAH